ncbi:MAG: preprotein translocase subunit YajC [Elusimicrobia bacterium]|nr:preprotein translocase subunit YajC [Elusimicrobiota bacterium]
MKRKKVFTQRLALFSLSLAASASAWAMAGAPNRDPNAPPPPAWVQWVPMLVLVGVFYFFLLRPQSKQRQERETMMGGLKRGDKIVTQSGFIATVVNVAPKFIEVKLNDETKVKMLKSGVSEILSASAEADLGALANSNN